MSLLLRSAGVAVLLDTAGEGLPRVLHWGRDLGDLDPQARERLLGDLTPAVPHSALDGPWPLTLLPGQAEGWSGRPGLAGERDGAVGFPRWRTDGVPAVVAEPDGAQCLEVGARDARSGLRLHSELRLEADGLVRIRHTVTNEGTTAYRLGELLCLLPVPETASEVLDLTGRWCRERVPQRGPLHFGGWTRESRRGRTGHDAPLLLACGTPGFGFRHGEVWAVHVAWSGNHVHLAERMPEGAGAHGGAVLGGGELLLPGEGALAPGERYTSPWVVYAYSENGLDGASARVHRWLRSRPGHPGAPRPLVLNTWEAVYFDHDLDRLTTLAECAASIGVERFVLDDGWFGGRRHDRAGLGDWYVAEPVWPQGLRPLADRVRALGMDFGLWFEPEMVNLDSDLVRAHPDWVLGPGPVDTVDPPPAWRHQYLLNVAVPGAYAYLLERIDTLVKEIGVAFIKWDHNRDLHEAGVHAQTSALYRLLDELRERNPALEIESCASGGGRVDLGVLEHTDRVWASDTNDALERQQIQRWTSLLLPPELVGSHVGGPVSHTTGRVADLGMRCLTALIAHAGIEWDITTCTADELAQLAGWAGLYKELRGLLHTGDVVRVDPHDVENPLDPDTLLHGVVARDRGEAVFEYTRIRTSTAANPGRLRLPGLDPDRLYRVRHRDEAGLVHGLVIRQPEWWIRGEALASGAVLASVGLPAPLLNPAQAALLHLRSD